MAQRFGEVLRRLRRKSDKTLGDLADELRVSAVYVSDVERGNRKPFATERIIRIAQYLGEDPREMLEAADRERGVIEYDISNGTPLEAKVVGELVTGLARGGITEEKLREIQEILKETDE